MTEPAGNNGVPMPPDESNRLEALRKLQILDTEAEKAYDDITLLASHVCNTPISLISLVDKNRQWFKSKVGMEASETPREAALCAHAILKPDEMLIVPDASADERFRDSPLVKGEPRIRFYAGVPLTTHGGHALGALCVIDNEPRELKDKEMHALRALGRQVISQLELRQALTELDRYRTDLESLNKDLERRSLTDNLTGLWNRAAFERRLKEETARVHRSGEPIALLFIDVDGFKDYNDARGHLAGDKALVRIAELLRINTRENDFECRFGGDEFTVLLPGTVRIECVRIAERIRDTIASEGGLLNELTVSVGISYLRGKTAEAEKLISAADACLYEAKKRGRNRIVWDGA